MANPTKAQQITALEAELVIVKAGMANGNAGISSFTLGDMSVTQGSYTAMAARRTAIEKSLQRLYRGGRGIAVDMSVNANGGGYGVHEACGLPL